jgi:cytochrome P450
MPQGALILPAILSANRDGAVFENPDQLDIRRTPNKHLAFGKGIHYCLGAPLARLEGKIAFCTLLQRCPNLRLNAAPEQLRYLNMLIVHRLEALPVAV